MVNQLRDTPHLNHFPGMRSIVEYCYDEIKKTGTLKTNTLRRLLEDKQESHIDPNDWRRKIIDNFKKHGIIEIDKKKYAKKYIYKVVGEFKDSEYEKKFLLYEKCINNDLTVFNKIKELTENKTPWTEKSLAKKLVMKISTVHKCIQRLRERGMLVNDYSRPRLKIPIRDLYIPYTLIPSENCDERIERWYC